MGGWDMEKQSRRPRPPAPASKLSAAAEDGDIVRDPAVVGHAGAPATVGHRRTPEPDAVEFVHAVVLAAFVTEQRIALAGRRNRWHRTEPGREITLQLRTHRMLQPHVGAVGMRSEEHTSDLQ